EEYYNSLMKRCLTDFKERKVCIVIENLDRVSDIDALLLVSTLKPFLQYSHDDPEWKRRIFFLIPFDDTGMEKIWKDDQGLTQTFMEKLFQIRLYVPIQLLSDWQ